ncbi:unnamed protein product [Rotaria magnacalcarata]|uniref:tRNA (guanine(26)-N(2))-dimethyltransferase n=1 Tax=Rotaria magnacalcarata TaxID=392030 RepID=A0A8S2LNI8_9BILA|nr:unnamed protein product [Rotaria magnacalcarata]
MISYLLRIRVNFLIRTSILNRRLSTVDINDNEDYSLSTIMTDSVQVKEGKANIHLPEGAVFYNPAQVFNRDLSVACLRLVSKYHHENESARYDRIIEPLLCMSIDFYVRLFVRISYGAAKAQSQLGDIATVYNCTYCSSFFFQRYGQASLDERGNAKFRYAHGPPVGTHCSHCESNLRVGGPIWLGPLFDHSFVNELITSIEQAPDDSYAYRDRMLSMLYVVKEELPDPLYFDNGKLARVMHTHIPQNKVIKSALLNAGYRVSTSHARQDSIKTNAPHHVIWDIMRAFAELSSTKRASTERLNTESPYYRLLTKPSTIQVDFTEHPDWESEARKNKLIRFMGNPHARWGPLGKAVTKNKRSSEDNDSIQNKKQAKSDEDSPTEEVL